MSRWGILQELGRFITVRKKYFLAPLILVLLLMGLFILLAEIPALTPFIYALF